MLGRDKLAERGATLGSPSQWDDRDDELMEQATQLLSGIRSKRDKKDETNRQWTHYGLQD